MKCLRCLDDTASRIAVAPDGSGAWEIYYCEKCNYSWRSTEEKIVTDIAQRNPRFQLDKTDFSKVPSLR